MEKAAEQSTRVVGEPDDDVVDFPSGRPSTPPKRTSSIERMLETGEGIDPVPDPLLPMDDVTPSGGQNFEPPRPSVDDGIVRPAHPAPEPPPQPAPPAQSAPPPESGFEPERSPPVDPAPAHQDPGQESQPSASGVPERYTRPEPAPEQPTGPERYTRAEAASDDVDMSARSEQFADVEESSPARTRKKRFGRRKDPKPWHRQAEAADPVDGHPDEATAAAPEEQPEFDEEPPARRGFFGAIWGVIRFLLIGKKKPKKTRRAVKGTRPQKAGRKRFRPKLPTGLKVPRVPRGLMRLLARIPGLGRLVRRDVVVRRDRAVAAAAERAEDGLPASRRDEAVSHMRRPLDLSHRVGRAVEIDIEKVRAAGMIAPFGERTHIAEEFRLIKRPLLLTAFEKGPNAIRNGNVIMVASSRSGEGKTFTAINLAMSIASERDLTVLLIDADVAKPDIPNVLGFEADLGLVDLIADDQIAVSDVIMRTNIENLSVLPAGRPHHLATELLASERMEMLMSELSLRYPERVVIVDSPPALLSSIAGVLALNVGQTLFVVEAERTSQTAVDSAIGLVSACKNINLLLNKSRPLGGNERFGSYQGSYY